ncbi:MAG TPA: arylesterase, partial [Reyranella sp.]|nr:arylesterase [Reyranella sp.]
MRAIFWAVLFVMLAGAGSAQSQGREIRIVTFGDSGPAGDGVKTSEAYPAVLQATLRARGINAAVQNISTSGLKTSQGLERVDS